MLKDKEKRIEILDEVTRIQNKHCVGCEDPKKYTSKSNVSTAYCTGICSYGKQIRDLGRKLEGESSTEGGRGRKKSKRPLESVYTSRKKLGMTNRQIAKELGISTSKLQAWKQEWMAFHK